MPSEQIYLEPIAQIGHDVVLTRGVRSNPCVYSINITGKEIYEDYSLLSNNNHLNNDWVITNEYDYFVARDNLVHHNLISTLPKKRLKNKV